jgi:hypothetical protein
LLDLDQGPNDLICTYGGVAAGLKLKTRVNANGADGRDRRRARAHNRADLSKWFEKLHDRKGDLCCDGSEAMHLSEVDWEINGNHYRVRVPTTSGGFARVMAGATNVETEWVYVPDDTVIDEPNRANVTLVWPLYGPMGVSVRCFMHSCRALIFCVFTQPGP